MKTKRSDWIYQGDVMSCVRLCPLTGAKRKSYGRIKLPCRAIAHHFRFFNRASLSSSIFIISLISLLRGSRLQVQFQDIHIRLRVVEIVVDSIFVDFGFNFRRSRSFCFLFVFNIQMMIDTPVVIGNTMQPSNTIESF